MSKIANIIGDWASLIGGEFRKPYMKDLDQKIKQRRSSLTFNKKEVLPPRDHDLFEVFKRTPIDKVKVLYVVETTEHDNRYFAEIERELRDGLDLNLTSNENFWWLHEQGIMFFPRCLTWDKDGEPHPEWKVFTDEVLLAVTGRDRPTLVVTDHSDLQVLMHEMRPHGNFISKLRPWEYIDEWVKKNYKEEIRWTPPFE